MKEERDIVIGLAGSPNVGKSTFFHQITGVGVTISNYPGTTVEVAEGETNYQDRSVKVIDLPGTYSLNATAEDERVAGQAILEDDIDVVLNILDASNLERNLYLTLQLIELNVPVVVALNQYDEALDKGMEIDSDKLSDELGVPVIETVATEGKNVSEAFDKAVQSSISGGPKGNEMTMGKEIEKLFQGLTQTIEEELENIPFKLPARTLAIHLLVENEEIENKISNRPGGERILEERDKFGKVIQNLYDENAPIRIARERHGIAGQISEKFTERAPEGTGTSERISRLTTDLKTGVPILIGVFLGLLALLFFVGGFIERNSVGFWENSIQPILKSFFYSVSPNTNIAEILNIGINRGIKGILAVMFPYLVPFFLALAVIEDSGYLPRMAFVMDSMMHKIGLHGKAVVPMLGGFGCNVPAIMATRSLNSRRERVISSFLITMIPCSARTVVILGTVGAFVGIFPSLFIYLIILVLIFVVGLLLNKFMSGETSGMVMEMPPLRKPMLKPVLSKTWNRLKDFVYVATPLLLVGSLIIGALDVSGVLNSIVGPLSPLTLGVLGLPPVVIIPLLYGIIRKEGSLVLLMSVAPAAGLASFMSDLQFFVFALVVAIYLPCIATFSAIKKELGWKDAILISLATIGLAIAVGAIFFHLNPLGLST